jgi:hypothetical protein
MPVAAQSPPVTIMCRNTGAVITCTLPPAPPTPAAAAEAFAIFTGSTTPYTPEPPAPVVLPPGSTEIGTIHGEVFSDRWPYESAGIYAPVFSQAGGHFGHGRRVVRQPYDRAVVPGAYRRTK